MGFNSGFKGLTSALNRGVQSHPPAALPPGETRYPLYRRLGGPQSPWAKECGPSEVLSGSHLVDASVGGSSLWLVGRCHSLSSLVRLKYAPFGVFLDSSHRMGVGPLRVLDIASHARLTSSSNKTTTPVSIPVSFC